jgi:hypothetical protein
MDVRGLCGAGIISRSVRRSSAFGKERRVYAGYQRRARVYATLPTAPSTPAVLFDRYEFAVRLDDPHRPPTVTRLDDADAHAARGAPTPTGVGLQLALSLALGRLLSPALSSLAWQGDNLPS